MKHKFSLMGRVAIALVLALSLSLVMAVPAAASHDSTATVAFTLDASTQQNATSSLDVEVTSSAASSLGNINEVVIDFNTGTTATEFTALAGPTGPGSWTGVVEGNIVTFTGDTIAPAAGAVFVIPVTNPTQLGSVPNPTVTTSDVGSKAELEASADTGWIGYVADAIGSAGNNITVEYLDADAWSLLGVTVVGNAISVELADDGTDPTSTATLVAAAINDDTAAGALVTAAVEGEHGSDLVPVMSATALSDGSTAQVNKDCLVTGELVITELLLTVDVTATPATSASLANYDIDFTTIAAIAADETISITFPAGYDITDVQEGDVSLIVVVTPYTTGTVTKVGQVVTITGDGTNAIAGPSEAVEVTISGTPEPVKNPPASGDYDIAVVTTIGDHGTGEVTIIPDSFGVVAGTDDTVTAGAAFAVTVTALNAADPAETDIGYTGAHFIDFAWVGSPAGTPTLLAFDLITFTAGEGTSDQYFVLTDVESGITITADATEPAIHGVSDEITINPATFVKFTIAGEPTPVTAGEDFGASDITVTALDADDNVVTGYVGTVTWDSSDDDAELPGAYTFDAEDEGVHTFLGSLFTLKTVDTADDQTITVTDAVAGVSTESGVIVVEPAAADSIVVSASTDVIEADGTDSSTITATAKDEFGNTDTNYTAAVTFAASLGEITVVDATFGATDPGKATNTLASDGEVGTATIKVTSGTLPYGLTTVKLLALIGIDALTVTADLSTIRNDGVDVRTITATYVDATPATVTAADGADYTVTFTTDIGDPTEVTLNPADGVVVPVNGVATVTLTTTAGLPTDIIVTATGTGVDNPVTITVTQGTYSISLAAGWNLISVPLMLTDETIGTVMADLAVISVRTFKWEADVLGEEWWKPGVPASDLLKVVDGQGYWIEMSAADALVVVGSEYPAPGGMQPSYDLHIGWNLIGFKSLDTATTVANYLGAAIEGTLEAMYGYDATAGTYFIPGVEPHTNLEPGCGYWLAVSEAGTIYP